MTPRRRLADTRAAKLGKSLRTRYELRRLSSEDDRVRDAVAAALRDVLERRLDPDESDWVAKIEALRTELNASFSTELTLTDYGAVSPNLDLTAEQIYEGRIVTRTLAEISMDSSKYPLWTLFLFKLLRHLQPSQCLELGTHIGISGAYHGAALQLNATGSLMTLEGTEPLARVARENFSRLGLRRVEVTVGRFQDTLQSVLRDRAPIGYAFVDGLHEKHATINFFREIVPFVEKDAVLVFDDIRWSPGMAEAWQAIRADDAVRVDVNLGTIGLCILGTDTAKQSFDLSHFRTAVDDAYGVEGLDSSPST